MDINIVNVVLDVFEEYGEAIRFDFDRFEEAINDHSPLLMDECYLIMLGFKSGIFDALIFDEEIDVSSYVRFLMEEIHLKEDESVFLISVLETILDNIGYYFEIPDIQKLIEEAYERHDFIHLSVIAKSYFYGFGVQQDYEKAFEIYSYLYSQGYDKGTYYLGFMYEKGYGIERDIEKALMYYQSKEDDMCCFRLGIFYMLGQYVEKNEQKAIYYLSLSEYKEAYLYKGILLEKQREYALAFASFEAGAKLYQPECLYRAAMALRTGVGVELDLEEAYRCFEYGYYLMHGDCAYQLALMSFDGIVHEKNEKKALNYLKEATELYSYDGYMLLGKLYESGKYVHKDIKKATSYFQKALDIQSNNEQRIIESFEVEDEII